MAALQSRSTVRVETPRVQAVSSRVRSPKKPALDHAALALVDGLQPREGLIEREQQLGSVFAAHRARAKRMLRGAMPPLLRLLAAGPVDENMAHHPGGDAVEVRAVGRFEGRLVSKPQVGLVDEVFRRERAAPEVLQPATGNAAERIVDQREEAVDRLVVAGLPGRQQLGDCSRVGGRHGSRWSVGCAAHAKRLRSAFVVV